MDRIDAMTAFVATADASGFSAAARKLGKSTASVTRAVAFLEARTGAALLRRTTRSVKLTEEGERYLGACRRLLVELQEAEQAVAGEQASPRGTLSVTAPVTFGRLHLTGVVDAFLRANQDVQVRLLLLDRVVSLVDEGMDVAVRIAHLPDSSLVAVKVGEVRRVLCASPAYLARQRAPKHPSELTARACISFSQLTASDTWTFAGVSSKPLSVKVRPRLFVNTADAAVGSAEAGLGIASVLSYQVAKELASGRLVRLLGAFEPEPVPVHVACTAAGTSSGRVRAFLNVAVPALREALAPPGRHRESKKRARRGE